MRDDSPQWRDVGEPASPAEAEALRAIKAMLPDGAICSAWSNVSFSDLDGRLWETDLLLLTQRGMFLVELKGWSGRISGGQRRWLLARGEVENPRILNDTKAKRLKSLLESLAPGNRRPALPRIQAITCLHGANCTVALDDPSKADTYGLDGYGVVGVPLFSELLAQPARALGDMVDRPGARAIVDLINSAGFEAPARVRMVAQYAVDQLSPVSQGPTWVDVIAENPHLPGLRKRIRLFDVPRDASAERRAQIRRAAERELRLTTGLAHPGVVGPSDISQDEQGRPALVFDFDPKAQRLDEWLAANFRIERREIKKAQRQSDHADEGFADAHKDVAELWRHAQRLPAGRQHQPSPRRAQRAALDTYRWSRPRNVTALTMTNGCSRNI